MRQDFYFWTFSVDYDFNLCRTLVNGIGCNSELPYAPLDLPICQINPLPFQLNAKMIQTKWFSFSPPSDILTND